MNDESGRWDRLFGDLEALVEAQDRAAFDADVADRGRAERAALGLADRLRGHLGVRLTLRLVDGDRLEGAVTEVGPDWLALNSGGMVLVPHRAIAAVAGLGAAAAPREEGRGVGLPLTVMLRGLARDRMAVRVRLVGTGVVEGTIDRVSADHLDLAEHPADEPRRASAVRGVLTLRTEAVLLVRVV